jgi:1,4-alpha-glucan branching enzyme
LTRASTRRAAPSTSSFVGEDPGRNKEVTSFTADDLYLFNEGTHRNLASKLGAHVLGDHRSPATYFAVWAPNARSAAVVGDFNGWDPDAHPLRELGGPGIWEGVVCSAGPGQVYKYEITTVTGARVQKADPVAFRCEEPPRTG